MNIAIIGYGKMGREIEQIARTRGHHIMLIIDENNQDELSKNNLDPVDVAIEFTSAKTAESNILKCFDSNTPVVSGTTGWQEGLERLRKLAKEGNQSFFYAPNYSIGVFLFSALNKQFASWMNALESYDIQLHEIHHEEKKDKPSGTAIALAESIIEHYSRKQNWVSDPENKILPESIAITSERVGQVPGTHSIVWDSDVDQIELKHTSKNRIGFAQGAVIAAEFLKNKKGFFGLSDMIGF